MQDIKVLAPNVRFVADQGVSHMRLQANKLGVLTASRRSAQEIVQLLNQLDEDGASPIWDELSAKYGYATIS